MPDLDPEIEVLLESQQERQSAAPSARALLVQLCAGATMFAAIAAMAVVFPAGSWADPAVLVALVLAYALASMARFDIGSGYTSAVQLIFIPMWFAAPPQYLPLLVAAGLVLHKAAEIVFARRGHPVDVLLVVPDAWYAVGPAVVIGAFGVTEPSLADLPIYALALLAQVIVDASSGSVRAWAEFGLRPGLQLRVLGWVFTVDAALAPLGLLAALVMVEHPMGLLCLLPAVWLLAQFARERDGSIRQALQLSSAYRGTAILLGDVLEDDDEYTGGEHTQGVVEMGLAVGKILGLDAAQLRDLEFGSLLHDIGKLRVPNEIINKPGKLNDEEWAIIKMHPQWGQEMLDRIGGAMANVGVIVRAHHERVDGGGYPDGLVGGDIPMAARIICVCDSYSAMTTNRSYRPAMPQEEAVAELRRCVGGQFDADVVEALIQVVEGNAVPHPAPLRLAA